MPCLSNARHELFAQAVAIGKTARQAYKEAGYKPHDGSASVLRNNPKVSHRIAELQTERLSHVRATKEWVVASLLQVAERCMGAKVSIKGREIAYRFDSAGANRALELLGRELGMFGDKSEVDHNIRVISAQPMSEEGWQAKYGREPRTH